MEGNCVLEVGGGSTLPLKSTVAGKTRIRKNKNKNW
jgi:hypothetical protein